MIQGKQAIRNWFIENNLPYFAISRLQDKNSGNHFFANTDKADQDFPLALIDLDKALSFISTGQFFIVADDSQKVSSKGRRQAEFTISLADTQTPATPAISGPGLSYEEIEAKAEKIALDKFENLINKRDLENAKKELEEQKKKVTELEKQVSSPWNKFADAIAPYAPNIISGLFPNAGPAIGNIPPTDNKLEDNTPADDETIQGEENEAAGIVIKDFIEALRAKYPDTWLQVLQKLTNKIKTDPGMIDMAIKMLG